MPGLSFEDYVCHDALGLAGLISRGEVSATDVIEAAIARAEAVNPRINAVVETLYEPARAAALSGLEGPLAGVPWAVKDLGHEIAGVRMTSGSRGFQDYIAAADSESVRRMKAAGLNIFATSTSPEFGLTVTTESTLHGQTRNHGISQERAAAHRAARPPLWRRACCRPPTLRTAADRSGCRAPARDYSR